MRRRRVLRQAEDIKKEELDSPASEAEDELS